MRFIVINIFLLILFYSTACFFNQNLYAKDENDAQKSQSTGVAKTQNNSTAVSEQRPDTPERFKRAAIEQNRDEATAKETPKVINVDNKASSTKDLIKESVDQQEKSAKDAVEIKSPKEPNKNNEDEPNKNNEFNTEIDHNKTFAPSIVDIRLQKLGADSVLLTFITDSPFITDVKFLDFPSRIFINFRNTFQWKVENDQLNKIPVTIISQFRYFKSKSYSNNFKVSVDLTKTVYLGRAYSQTFEVRTNDNVDDDYLYRSITGNDLMSSSSFISIDASNVAQSSNENQGAGIKPAVDTKPLEKGSQSKAMTRKYYSFSMELTSNKNISDTMNSNMLLVSLDKPTLEKISYNTENTYLHNRRIKRNKLADVKVREYLDNISYPHPKSDYPGREVVVFVDPGHGGKDPGAISNNENLIEKELVLQFSKVLKKKLEENPSIQVILTRSGDYYLPLHDRILWAQRMGADLFVSIHADNTQAKTKTHGLSVYYLSDMASDAQTQLLMNAANSYDINQGIIDDKTTQKISEILLTLSQRSKVNDSILLAQNIINQHSKLLPVMVNPIRSAGFAVLKLPNAPSVLVELGFLSNSEDRSLFLSSDYMNRASLSLSVGIEYYLWKKGLLEYFPTNVANELNALIAENDNTGGVAKNVDLAAKAVKKEVK